MKFRNEFVTNSSSSSFVCDICGCAEAGYDACAGDLGFNVCENGCIVCFSHVQVTADQLRNAAIRYSKDVDRDTAILIAGRCEEVIAEYGGGLIDGEALERINFDELPEELCPVCTMSAVPNDVLLRYAIHHYGTTRDKLVDELRREFDDIDKLKRALRNIDLR